MSLKKDQFEKIVKGKKQIIYPLHKKKEIVKELEMGELSLQEALSKYGIHKLDTLKDWLRKYSSLDKSEYLRMHHPETTKRKVVREIDSALLTVKEAAKKYSVMESTIQVWIKQYSCTVNSPQKASSMVSIQVHQDENTQQLNKIIQELQLKVTGLEIMIDIAEKELQIDIRKKSGTKQ